MIFGLVSQVFVTFLMHKASKHDQSRGMLRNDLADCTISAISVAAYMITSLPAVTSMALVGAGMTVARHRKDRRVDHHQDKGEEPGGTGAAV